MRFFVAVLILNFVAVECMPSHRHHFPNAVYRSLNYDRKSLGWNSGNYPVLSSESLEYRIPGFREDYLQAVAQLINNAKIVSTDDGQAKVVYTQDSAETQSVSSESSEDSRFKTLVQKYGTSPVSSHYANAQIVESRYENPSPLFGPKYGKGPFGARKYGTGSSQDETKTSPYKAGHTQYRMDNLQLSAAGWQERARKNAEIRIDQDNYVFQGSKMNDQDSGVNSRKSGTDSFVIKLNTIDPVVKDVIFTQNVEDMVKTKETSGPHQVSDFKLSRFGGRDKKIFLFRNKPNISDSNTGSVTDSNDKNVMKGRGNENNINTERNGKVKANGYSHTGVISERIRENNDLNISDGSNSYVATKNRSHKQGSNSSNDDSDIRITSDRIKQNKVFKDNSEHSYDTTHDINYKVGDSERMVENNKNSTHSEYKNSEDSYNATKRGGDEVGSVTSNTEGNDKNSDFIIDNGDISSEDSRNGINSSKSDVTNGSTVDGVSSKSTRIDKFNDTTSEADTSTISTSQIINKDESDYYAASQNSDLGKSENEDGSRKNNDLDKSNTLNQANDIATTESGSFADGLPVNNDNSKSLTDINEYNDKIQFAANASSITTSQVVSNDGSANEDVSEYDDISNPLSDDNSNINNDVERDSNAVNQINDEATTDRRSFPDASSTVKDSSVESSITGTDKLNKTTSEVETSSTTSSQTLNKDVSGYHNASQYNDLNMSESGKSRRKNDDSDIESNAVDQVNENATTTSGFMVDAGLNDENGDSESTNINESNTSSTAHAYVSNTPQAEIEQESANYNASRFSNFNTSYTDKTSNSTNADSVTVGPFTSEFKPITQYIKANTLKKPGTNISTDKSISENYDEINDNESTVDRIPTISDNVTDSNDTSTKVGKPMSGLSLVDSDHSTINTTVIGVTKPSGGSTNITTTDSLDNISYDPKTSTTKSISNSSSDSADASSSDDKLIDITQVPGGPTNAPFSQSPNSNSFNFYTSVVPLTSDLDVDGAGQSTDSTVNSVTEASDTSTETSSTSSSDNNSSSSDISVTPVTSDSDANNARESLNIVNGITNASDHSTDTSDLSSSDSKNNASDTLVAPSTSDSETDDAEQSTTDNTVNGITNAYGDSTNTFSTSSSNNNSTDSDIAVAPATLNSNGNDASESPLNTVNVITNSTDTSSLSSSDVFDTSVSVAPAASDSETDNVVNSTTDIKNESVTKSSSNFTETASSASFDSNSNISNTLVAPETLGSDTDGAIESTPDSTMLSVTKPYYSDLTDTTSSVSSGNISNDSDSSVASMSETDNVVEYTTDSTLTNVTKTYSDSTETTTFASSDSNSNSSDESVVPVTLYSNTDDAKRSTSENTMINVTEESGNADTTSSDISESNAIDYISPTTSDSKISDAGDSASESKIVSATTESNELKDVTSSGNSETISNNSDTSTAPMTSDTKASNLLHSTSNRKNVSVSKVFNNLTSTASSVTSDSTSDLNTSVAPATTDSSTNSADNSKFESTMMDTPNISDTSTITPLSSTNDFTYYYDNTSDIVPITKNNDLTNSTVDTSNAAIATANTNSTEDSTVAKGTAFYKSTDTSTIRPNIEYDNSDSSSNDGYYYNTSDIVPITKNNDLTNSTVDTSNAAIATANTNGTEDSTVARATAFYNTTDTSTIRSNIEFDNSDSSPTVAPRSNAVNSDETTFETKESDNKGTYDNTDFTTSDFKTGTTGGNDDSSRYDGPVDENNTDKSLTILKTGNKSESKTETAEYKSDENASSVERSVYNTGVDSVNPDDSASSSVENT